MRPLTRTRRALRKARRRAATMLEFALILPIFMFMLMFAIDMGHLVLMSGAMQDATFSAARTGAQVGGAAVDTQTGTTVCTEHAPCERGATYQSLLSGAQQIPGYGTLGELDRMTIVSGGICANSLDDDHVQIRTRYRTDLITPGLGSMLNMFTPSDRRSTVDDGRWTLTATAVARCEVIRTRSMS